MILESIKYMILGMGVVFLFLYLIVVILDWQHKMVEKYFPEDEDKTTGIKKDKLKKVAAIATAIHHMKNS